MGDFLMPSLGADMEDGTLVEWLVEVGTHVDRGDIIAVVETQKGAIEIETFEAGTVQELVVPEGDRVPVGTVLARIGEGSAQPASVLANAADAAAAPEPAIAAEPDAPVAAPPKPGSPPAAPYRSSIRPAPASREGWVRSSPSARKRAHELGVDLADCTGTGPHGAVTRKDVEALTAPSSAAPAPPAASAEDPMRRAIAAAMSRANRDIPHYYLAQEIDLSAALGWLTERNADRSIHERILPAALLVKAVALALEKHPSLNGTWVSSDADPVGSFRPAEGIHPGIAISLRGGGLVIPALFDVADKDLPTVMAELTDLVERARAGRLRGGELSRSTLTITNLGDQGVDVVQGVVYPPQVALVGFGRIAERPVAVDGMLGVRPTVVATLAADHRASDGHTGARFLSRLQRLLAKPEKLQ